LLLFRSCNGAKFDFSDVGRMPFQFQAFRWLDHRWVPVEFDFAKIITGGQ